MKPTKNAYEKCTTNHLIFIAKCMIESIANERRPAERNAYLARFVAITDVLRSRGVMPK